VTLPTVLPLLGLEGITLKSGSHERRESGVCAMEALAWIAGEPHSDDPQCACPVIGAFMRSWNDGLPNDEDRTRLLRPLLPLLVGSRSTEAVEIQRSWLALDWLARECAPAFLSLRDDLKAHAVALRGLAPLTDSKSAKAAQKTLDAARDAARAAAGAAARDAAGAAAGAAARAAARDAAGAAAWDAARAAAWAAAGDAARDALAPTVKTLQLSATELVKRMVSVTSEASS